MWLLCNRSCITEIWETWSGVTAKRTRKKTQVLDMASAATAIDTRHRFKLYIAVGRLLDDDLKRRIAIGIAKGCLFMHSKGIAHRVRGEKEEYRL